MTSITIEYKPLSFLPRRTASFNMPSDWNELTRAQIAAIPLLRRGMLSAKKVLRIFSDIKRSVLRKIDSYSISILLNELGFLNTPGATSTFLIKKLGAFKAPDDKMRNVSFGQFMYADTYFQSYIDGKTDDLSRFVACLYVNGKGFKEKSINANASIIKTISPVKLEAIAVNYTLIREWLAASYPYVFSRSEGRKKKNSPGWVALFDQVVGTDIVNSDKYARKPVNEMLRFLNNQQKEYYRNGRNIR